MLLGAWLLPHVPQNGFRAGLRLLLVALPAMLAPPLIGARLNHRVGNRAFRRFVLILLLISGVILLLHVLRKAV